jgi:hypothetical protein
LNETQNSPATLNVGIINIPPQECTPLMAIPGNLSFSSQVLNFDDVVVAVGEYYYSDKTKGIEKRKERGKEGIQLSANHQPKELLNGRQGLIPKKIPSKLPLLFMHLQGKIPCLCMTWLASLDTTQAIIVELENTMNTQKDDITIEFEKGVKIAENIHKEEIEKVCRIKE